MAVFSLDRRIVVPNVRPWGFEMGAVGGWLPTELSGLVLWLDAADADTITLDGSDNVEQWADKSGSGNNTVGVLENRPVVETVSDKEYIRFSTAGSLSVTPSRFLWDGDAVSTFIVLRLYGYDNTKVAYCIGENIDGTRNAAALRLETSTATWIRTWGGAVSWGGVPVDSSLIIFNAYEGDQDWVLYRDGALISVSQNTFGTNIMQWAPSNLISIGNNWQGTNNLNGSIGEFLIYGGTISESNRQKVEGYLAHKWGLTANLPSAHPYKTEAP